MLRATRKACNTPRNLKASSMRLESKPLLNTFLPFKTISQDNAYYEINWLPNKTSSSEIDQISRFGYLVPFVLFPSTIIRQIKRSREIGTLNQNPIFLKPPQPKNHLHLENIPPKSTFLQNRVEVINLTMMIPSLPTSQGRFINAIL